MCQSPSKVLYDGECSDNCPDGFFPFSGICYGIFIRRNLECHKTCEACVTGGFDGCTLCVSDLFFFAGQCLKQCPDGTYANGTECVPCPHTCATCLSEDFCYTCNKDFYKIENKCVYEHECPNNTYPDEPTMTCKECHGACLGCFGPTSKQCIDCNYLKGYDMSEEIKGECNIKTCGEGSYRHISLTSCKVYCLPCNDTCKNCINLFECVECQPYLLSVPLGDYLVDCKECPRGYFFSDQGFCTGI